MKKLKLRAWVLGMDGEMKMAKDLHEEDACALYIREHNRQKESCRVMLYSGLKDSQGNEIWEGDIFLNGESIRTIEFSGGNFHAVTLRRTPSILLSFIHSKNSNRVIGNIYENPELLH